MELWLGIFLVFNLNHGDRQRKKEYSGLFTRKIANKDTEMLLGRCVMFFFNNFTKNCFGNLFLQVVKLPTKKWAYAILSVFKDKGFHKEWNKLSNVICIRLLHVINYKYDYQINPLFQCNFTAVNICIFVLQNYTWTGRLGGNPDLCKFFFVSWPWSNFLTWTT